MKERILVATAASFGKILKIFIKSISKTYAHTPIVIGVILFVSLRRNPLLLPLEVKVQFLSLYFAKKYILQTDNYFRMKLYMYFR